MNTVNALINLGDLTKPATVLIERVSDAVGGIAKPGQIVRVAKAEAKAEVVRAEARMQITEMEERGLQRMVREEGKHQENIENITAKAIPHLSDDAKPEEVEDDWLTHFFDRSRLVSDEEMQSLWSNILAGQANRPGTFSKKTLDLVATFDKSDTELFTKLCSFVWKIGTITPLVFDLKDEIVNRAEINFDSLTHLVDIGLITFAGISGFAREGLPKLFTIFYYGRPVNIEFENDKIELDIGKVLLTRSGRELVAICGSRPNEDHYEHILSEWAKKGYALSCPVNSKPRHPAV